MMLHRPMVTFMRLPCRRLVRCLLTVLALAPALPAFAAPAECDIAIGFAQIVVNAGEQTMTARNAIPASDLAASSRIPAIDAARYAKACNCPEAIPPLADAALAAQRTAHAVNLTAVQQYGETIKKGGEQSIAALKRCAAR
jgi:hypothetical protein